MDPVISSFQISKCISAKELNCEESKFTDYLISTGMKVVCNPCLPVKLISAVFGGTVTSMRCIATVSFPVTTAVYVMAVMDLE